MINNNIRTFTTALLTSLNMKWLYLLNNGPVREVNWDGVNLPYKLIYHQRLKHTSTTIYDWIFTHLIVSGAESWESAYIKTVLQQTEPMNPANANPNWVDID